ncbi:hypothetical protein HDV00_012811 [Rhizophlyctis rosea]|nr:hypothetical protein HDV00_012811 [Rhizophlyctis rosea]
MELNSQAYSEQSPQLFKGGTIRGLGSSQIGMASQVDIDESQRSDDTCASESILERMAGDKSNDMTGVEQMESRGDSGRENSGNKTQEYHGRSRNWMSPQNNHNRTSSHRSETITQQVPAFITNYLSKAPLLSSSAPTSNSTTTRPPTQRRTPSTLGFSQSSALPPSSGAQPLSQTIFESGTSPYGFDPRSFLLKKDVQYLLEDTMKKLKSAFGEVREFREMVKKEVEETVEGFKPEALRVLVEECVRTSVRTELETFLQTFHNDVSCELRSLSENIAASQVRLNELHDRQIDILSQLKQTNQTESASNAWRNKITSTLQTLQRDTSKHTSALNAFSARVNTEMGVPMNAIQKILAELSGRVDGMEDALRQIGRKDERQAVMVNEGLGTLKKDIDGVRENIVQVGLDMGKTLIDMSSARKSSAEDVEEKISVKEEPVDVQARRHLPTRSPSRESANDCDRPTSSHMANNLPIIVEDDELQTDYFDQLQMGCDDPTEAQRHETTSPRRLRAALGSSHDIESRHGINPRQAHPRLSLRELNIQRVSPAAKACRELSIPHPPDDDEPDGVDDLFRPTSSPVPSESAVRGGASSVRGVGRGGEKKKRVLVIDVDEREGGEVGFEVENAGKRRRMGD